MNTDNEWGGRLVKMMLFFDNVRDISESRQRGRKCRACGGQTIYAQLDDRDEPVSLLL
jgi:hypothetical protein